MVVLVTGAALTVRASYLHAKARLASVLIERAWKESERTGVAKKPWAWADLRPVARLKIPRLKFDEYVLDNASPRTLAFGPGIVGNGVGVGKAGNLVLAGHRTSWFLPLEQILPNDRVELEWFGTGAGELRKRSYRVERILVVEPSDVSLLGTSDEDALTLITCYPFGYGATSPQRFVIRAVPDTEETSLVNEP